MNRQQRRAHLQRQAGNAVPSAPAPAPTRDTRIVYGAGCTYWGGVGSIHMKTMGGHPLPVCPHCGGLLLEVPDEATWDAAVAAHAAAQGDPGYPAFMAWLRGRVCRSTHPSRGGETAFLELREAYEAQRGDPH